MSGKDNAKSWVVLCAVTFILFLEIGTIKSFSVLLPDLKEQLHTDTWIVGSCISIISGCGYLIGVFTGGVVKLFNPRLCLIITGLVAFVGMIVCSCAKDPFTLFIGLFLTGFLLFQENVALGVIPEYFDKYYHTAVGIAVSGAGLGIVIMPVLTQFLLHLYGWRATLFLISGLVLHSVPCSGLITAQNNTKPEDETLLPVNHSSNHYFTTKRLCDMFGASLLTRVPFITRVIVPSFALGYTLTGWIIYTVSFAVSNGATLREASIVATCGGIGMTVSRIVVPSILHKMFDYKQLLCMASFLAAISLSVTSVFVSFVGMCLTSVMNGSSIGILGTEMYISAKVNSGESEHFHAISWAHVFYGIASVLSGLLTGILFDVTERFTLSFNILAAIALLPAVILGIETFRQQN